MRFSGSKHLWFLLAASFLCGAAQASVCSSRAGKEAPAAMVDRYFFDPTLKREWTVTVDCAHPERPGTMTESNAPRRENSHRRAAAAGAASPGVAIVRAGSKVELWRSGNALIRLSGVALQSAPVGRPILVRAGWGNGLLHGIVRGPGSVELAENQGMQWSQP